MVFMNADNDLAPSAYNDFWEMGQVGSNDKLNVVVEIDLPGIDNTNRYLVQRGDTLDMANPVESLGEKNMGDYHALLQFVDWTVRNYPADHYILVIWNHGTGWRLQQQRISILQAALKTEGTVTEVGMKAISVDETDEDILYMHEVWQALNEAQRLKTPILDIVGYDACFMGMIEVAYQIKDNAHFMVASEEAEPVDGWPYHRILNDLVTSFDARKPEGLAKTIVQRYGEFYENYGNGTETMAAYNLGEDSISRLVTQINNFVENHNALPEEDKQWSVVLEARGETEEFHDECLKEGLPDQCWGVDLLDFAVELGTRLEDHDSQEVLLGLQLAIDSWLPISDKLVIANYRGSEHPEAYGVAIYFPPDRKTFLKDPEHGGYEDSNKDYPVAFVQDTQWDNWLRDQYLTHTQESQGGGIPPGGSDSGVSSDPANCEGYGEECSVHPEECDGRGTSWMVTGTIECRKGKGVCVATPGKDYCTGAGGEDGRCGGAYGNSCSVNGAGDHRLCAPGLVCARSESGGYQCNWGCAVKSEWCYMPDELSQQPGFGCY
jgi:hypothetical protein